MLPSVCRFSLPEQKIGALCNEKFKKASFTVENTHAHNLRLQIAAKLLEKFDSVERAFECYSEGATSRADSSPHRFTVILQTRGSTVDVCTDTDFRYFCIVGCLMRQKGMSRIEASNRISVLC